MSDVQFNPVNSALSGVILSLCVLFFYAIYGRVLGISGILSEILSPSLPKVEPLRYAFVGGLIAVGIGMSPVSVSFGMTWWEAASAGLLVGLGTALGRGCTSGHGLCGLARLSKRSFVAVASFMVSGMVTQSLLAAGEFSKDSLRASFDVDPSILSVLYAALAFFLVAFLTAPLAHQKHWTLLMTLSSFVVGSLFAFGLVKAGMTDPDKVKGFLMLPRYLLLSPPPGQHIPFDPSLAFVMAGGMMPNLILKPLIQSLIVRPRLAETWSLPTRRDVEWRLVLGSVLFGIGWVVGGICPGPGVVVAVPSLLLGNKAMLHWWMWYIIGLKIARKMQ